MALVDFSITLQVIHLHERDTWLSTALLEGSEEDVTSQAFGPTPKGAALDAVAQLMNKMQNEKLL